MSAIMQALGSGYNAKQILSYLSQHNPKLAAQVSSALNAGHTIEHVLNFISRNEKKMSKMGKITPEKSQTGNIYKQAQSSIHPSLTGMAKFAGNAALAAGGAYALSRAAPQLFGRGAIPGAQQTAGQIGFNPSSQPGPNSPGVSVIPRPPQAPQPQTAMPQNTGTAPNSGSGHLGMVGTSPIQQNQPQVLNQAQQPPIGNQVAPNIPHSQQVPQPQGFDTNIIKNSKAYKNQIDALINSGNGPEEIEAYLQKFNPQFIKTISKEGKGAFKDVVAQYIQEKTRDEAMQPEGSLPPKEKLPHSMPEEKIENVPIEEKQPEEAKPIAKNETVSSPHGVGEVKEIRNGQAIIDVDGKLHKVKEEDLETPLFSNDEVADAYDNLMAKIPEEHRSGFISWAGYDEARNVLGFIPRGGKYEELKNITPEEAAKIKEGEGVARTSGETREGLWVKGEPTRGGIISQIIWDRHHANKASEEKQLKFGFEIPKPEKEDRGMKPLFDEMAHAREKSRERERKKKEEERARKKKEKDEAKKRKK